MDTEASAQPGDLAAGEFAPWLGALRRALQGDGDSDVPCGTCTACCTSAQFVHITPEDHAARAHIPRELLFPAPQRPPGHLVMGFDERGHCPMLIDGGCSIYEHRPRTCRTYDCRVFAATGIDPMEPAKALIAQRVRRWQFEFPTPEDAVAWAAVRAAAAYVRERREGSTTEQAVLAIELHDVFLGADPDPADIERAVERRRGDSGSA
ncbi:MAG TPA: YkgJ family cysteine cluster protein [Acidimicrobiales bacterium]|jgi:Fe-S-cluster containining protein|nr:YkgJ family cysteine cluster protein [Acidimicrobiales bacterium]